jgi:hypothetical protein
MIGVKSHLAIHGLDRICPYRLLISGYLRGCDASFPENTWPFQPWMAFILVDAAAGYVRHLGALRLTQQSGYEGPRRGQSLAIQRSQGCWEWLEKIICFIAYVKLHDMDTLDSGRRWTGGLVCNQQKEATPWDGLTSSICLFFTRCLFALIAYYFVPLHIF